jgi:hypothetical protein
MFAAGEIDGSQLRRGRSVDLPRQLAGIDAVLAEALSVSPVAALLCDDEQRLADRWAASSPDIRGRVVSELMDAVAMLGRRRSRCFDPSTVEIHWC